METTQLKSSNMKLFERFKAKTPEFNKKMGQVFTAISAKLVAVEVVLQMYSINVPPALNYAIIGCAIGCALFAGYNGQKVEK